MLNQHVGCCLLMHCRVGWYVELTCWLTITVSLNSIISDQLLHLVIKETKKETICLLATFTVIITLVKHSDDVHWNVRANI